MANPSPLRRLAAGWRGLIQGETLNNIIDRVNGLVDGSLTGSWAGTFNGAIGGTTPAKASVTYLDESTGAALVAAGTTRADALALTKALNFIGTAAASTGVVLPAASDVGIGGSVTIFNGGANTIKVYGAGSDTIDGTAGATGVSLTNANRCIYFVSAAGTWISAKLGVVSS